MSSQFRIRVMPFLLSPAVLLAFCFLAHIAVAADTNCLSRPSGLLGYAASLKGTAVGVDIEGNIAYVGDWGPYVGALQAFDVSDPCNPVRKFALETPPDEIGDVAVLNGRAYVANDALGFRIFDVSNPAGPFLLLAARSDAYYAHSVFLKDGRYALVGYIYAWGRELAVYDVSAFPLQAALYSASVTGGSGDEFAVGNRAYLLAAGDAGVALDIIDIGDPMHPVRISSLPLPQNIYGEWTGEVRVAGPYAYLAMSTHMSSPPGPGGLRIVDVSTENNPRIVGRFDLPNASGIGWKGIGLAVSGNRAYVADNDGLHIFDISNPTSPTQIRLFPVPAAWAGSLAVHVEVRSNLAYVTIYGGPDRGGLAIYKVDIDQPPTADAGPDQVVECTGPAGTPVKLTGAGFDPEGGPLTYTWTGPFGTLSGPTIEPEFPLGASIVTLQVTDIGGNTASDTVQVTVRDAIAPAITAAATLPGGAPYIPGSWTNQTVIVSFHCVDGGSGVASITGPVAVSTNGTTNAAGVCADNAGNVAGASAIVKIDNSGPAVQAVSVTPNPVPVNASASIAATIGIVETDRAPLVSAEYKIDDGPPLPMSATKPPFDSTQEAVTSATQFTKPDVAQICVRGADAAGNLGPWSCVLVAAYDPTAGFVTGGGWILSAPGAYAANSLLTGKATFGFVSKYQKGANRPHWTDGISVPNGRPKFQECSLRLAGGRRGARSVQRLGRY